MPTPSANGACVYRVQDELMKLGVESDVVVDKYEDTSESSPYGKVYPAPFTNLETASSLLQKIKAVMLYPIYYPRDIYSYRNAIKEALSEKEYDAVIAVITPCNGALATIGFNNVLIYELDSLTNNRGNKKVYMKILKHRVKMLEHVIYQNSNYIFHMNSHKHYYETKKYKRYSKKSEYLDIPQLVNENIEDTVDEKHEVMRVLYSGFLQKEMRSPEYAIKLFKELKKTYEKELEVSFYSRGNCEDLIATAERETLGMILKQGYVSLEELNNAVGRADFLLSIGNKLPGKATPLPSKVISYMAYGKPIIHIEAGKNDVAKDYLSQYSLALIINPEEDFVRNVEKLKCFIEEKLDRRVTFEEVKQKFPMNTPEYTAKRIIEVVEKHCSGKVCKR